MATTNAGCTAYGAAFLKAMEAFVSPEQRLFEDGVTRQFLPPVARALLCVGPLRRGLLWMMERSAPGAYGGLVCRTRFIDDALRGALPCDVIIVGSGLDSRPYRMSELASTRVVEVDQPAIITAKQKVTRKLGAHVEYVAIDFESERIEDRVEVRAKTFFIWEGVTQYITRAAVDVVLEWVGRAPSGSEIVFTYVPLEVTEGRSTLFGVATAKSASRRAPWITGLDPSSLTVELRHFGLNLCEEVGAAEHRALYLAPVGRRLALMEVERVVRARVP